MKPKLKLATNFTRTPDGAVVGCATVVRLKSGPVSIVAPDRDKLVLALGELFGKTFDADQFHDVFIERRLTDDPKKGRD